MIFNDHSRLSGQHAFLSASKYHWINYDVDRLEQMYAAHQAARRGTEFHELAARLIKMGVRLPKNSKTLNMYVNDALGYGMQPEQVLFVSENCFGTTDAISFKRNMLRIHDLKMGVVPTSFKQLLVYAAMFCMEYGVRPMDIEIELRIYQSDETRIETANPDDITHIISQINTFDRVITQMRQEEYA